MNHTASENLVGSPPTRTYSLFYVGDMGIGLPVGLRTG